MKPTLHVAAVLAILLAGCGGPGGEDGSGDDGPVGDYHCSSITVNGATQPCDDQTTPLTLASDGTWTWYRNAGRYRVVSGQVDFSVDSDRYAGPPTWGLADIGEGTLTFHSHGQDTVWRMQEADGDVLATIAGAYHCETTVWDGIRQECSDTSTPLTLTPGGEWSYSSNRGQLSIAGSEVTFRCGSCYDGPSSWGSASIGPGTLTFHGHDTVFRKAS